MKKYVQVMFLAIVPALLATMFWGLSRLPAFDVKAGQARFTFNPKRHERDARMAEIQQRFGQGVAMLEAKQFEFAMTAFHRVLQLDPTLVDAHVNMGFALLGLGESQAARDFFDGATMLKPMQANAYYGLGMAYYEMGQVEAAIGAMSTYLHLTAPDDPYRTRAEGYLAQWREVRRSMAKELPSR